jgi:Domain of unknown function (DUF4357)
LLELYLKSRASNSSAVWNDEGLVVLAGSLAAKEFRGKRGKAENRYRKLREELLENGVLIEEDKYLKFTRNQSFNSPSEAGNVIEGYLVDGREKWKNSDGKSLREIEG